METEQSSRIILQGVTCDVEFLPLKEGAVMPKQADDYSIGHDLFVPEDILIPGHSRFYVPLGFAIGLPQYIEGKIEPRSGFSGQGMEGIGYKWEWEKLWGFLPVLRCRKGKYRFDCDVIVGKIDPGYKGEINVIVKNNDVPFILPKGTKISQMTFYKTRRAEFTKTDVLHGYDRGGGLGHSGNTLK